MLNNKARQGLRAAGIEPLTKKACVTATAQSVPWAKMATVPPWVVPNVLPTFWYRGRLANFLGKLEGFSNFFLGHKKNLEKPSKFPHVQKSWYDILNPTRWHHSHFGSRYRLGCCDHAGLFRQGFGSCLLHQICFTLFLQYLSLLEATKHLRKWL